LGHPEWRGTNENAQRRLGRIHDLEERTARGGRIATLTEGSPAPLGDRLTQFRVGGQRLNAVRGGAAPIRIEAAGFDRRDMNAERPQS
jgi:hypothetical protein